MTPTLQELGIEQLDAEHRLQLIGEIWESLSTEKTIPESHRQVLDRRLDAADADPAASHGAKSVLGCERGNDRFPSM